MRNFTLYLFGTVLLILAISQASDAAQTQHPDGKPKPAAHSTKQKPAAVTGTKGLKANAAGTNGQQKPTVHLNQVVSSLQSQIVTQAGAKLKESDPSKTLPPKAAVKALSFSSRVVQGQGTIYLVKLDVGKTIFHAKIQEPQQVKGSKAKQPNKLVDLVGPKQPNDPIIFFD